MIEIIKSNKNVLFKLIITYIDEGFSTYTLVELGASIGVRIETIWRRTGETLGRCRRGN